MSEQVSSANTSARKADSDAFKQLPKVVVAFLTFQKAISGDPSEGALSFPIQAFLKIRTRYRVDTEEDHPAMEKKLGRPPQLDFVGRSRSASKGRVSELAFALETKIHADGNDWGRVIRDVVKLLLLVKNKKTETAARYLLLVFPIGGRSYATAAGELSQKIWRLREEPIEFFGELLPWEVPEKKIRISTLPKPLVTKFVDALKEFKQTSIRDGVKVRLIAKNCSEDFASGLWKLNSYGPTNQLFEGPIAQFVEPATSAQL